MGRSLKTPDCKCVACERFRADGPGLWRDLEAAYNRSKTGYEAGLYEMLRDDLVKGRGCDLCDRKDALRIAFVPQVIKDFFRIEYLCEWCRNRIDYQRRALKWPVCWGSTPDEELKWFLLHDALEQFNIEVQRHSPAWIKRRAEHQAWLDSLPKYEHTPPVELNIRIKRRPPEASA